MKLITHTQTFTGGVNTVLAARLMNNNQASYILNCNVLSSAEGNVGIITSPKGTIPVQVALPEGENLTIGMCLNEESNKMYYAVWNALGYHSWYEFDYISLTVKLIFQSITFTGNVDILKWEKGKFILHSNIIDNNLLYWTMDGHPARKLNIQKSLERSVDGYGTVILDEYVRAAKKTSKLVPQTEYFTNPNIPTNSVYRNLFKFAVRYIYDDGEYSVFSDFSSVAVPSEEAVTGTLGVPKINNGIYVRVQTGGMLVKKIEIAMQRTDQDSVLETPSAWVSVVVLDKDVLGIPNNSEYAYEFYNNNTYLFLSPEEVNKQQSDFPKNPLLQEYTNNRIVYGNFKFGFPSVKIDMSAEVIYEDLFVPDGTANVLNNPSLVYTFIDHAYEKGGFLGGGGGWRSTIGRITVGPDVKSGNVFVVSFINDPFSVTITATLSDDSRTIAAKIRSAFTTHGRMNGSKGSYVRDIVTDVSGFTSFEFRVWNQWNADYIGVNTSVTPVNYSTLKDTGNSVLNEKLGSSYRYALRYEDQDDGRSLAYGGGGVVSINTINQLGSIKKASTILTINHKAPSWATHYSIVRTLNLTHSDYIQFLVQKVVTVTTTVLGEEYHDVMLGSMYQYNKVHPNSTLNYEFKKGDRIRLLKTVEGSTWTVPPVVVEYEVMDFFPEIANIVQANITVDGSAKVLTTPDSNNIGNNIVIAGHERVIISVESDGYILNSPISVNGADSEAPEVLGGFTIINRNGVLRIKMDPDYPIVANGVDKFSLVEVYKPTQTFTDISNEGYYDIGYKFEIYQDGSNYYHRGNNQDQTASEPAKIKIGGIGNYVRNRELITNDSVTNPQSKVTSIEDPSYSDFYVSSLSSYGRPTRLDDSRGEVTFDSSFIWSDPFIEDTNINGLNLFKSTNRVDYNDKYGSSQRIIFYEGRMYIFKYLKIGWVPVMGSIFTDTEGVPSVAISTKLLPDKMEYFLWEGGVASNPESVVKEGNNIHGVSPTSEVIFEIGGAGVVPTSKIYGIDNFAREIITGASKAGMPIVGSINRKNNQYVIMIPEYDIPSYSDEINVSNSWIVPVEDSEIYQIVTVPDNGSLSLSDGVFTYSPNTGFSGMDYFTYKTAGGITRQVCINVLPEDTQLVWKPGGQYCVVSGGTRTGFVGYSILEEYDNISETYTGQVKPNAVGDPDYEAPFEDLEICPIGLEYVKIGTLSRINNQTIMFNITSVESFNVVVKVGNEYSGAIISETGVVASGEHELVIPSGSTDASLFLVVDSSAYSSVSKFHAYGAYFKSARFTDLPNLLELVLDQSTISQSHNLPFITLDVIGNISLTKLWVIHHRLSSINLNTNVNIVDLKLNIGLTLASLTIGSWPVIQRIDVSECLFTRQLYSSAFVDQLIQSFNAVVPELGGVYYLKYGANNASGVEPSQSSSIYYNSLVDKGVTIIGRPPKPIVQSVWLTLNLLTNHNSVRADFILDESLSVPISITVFGTLVDVNGNLTSINDLVIMEAGMAYYGKDYFTGSGFDIEATEISIENVLPNPAGGIQINY